MASSPRVKFAAAAVVRGIPLRNWYKATFFCIYSVNWTLQINKNPTTQKTNQNPKIQQRKKAKKKKNKRGWYWKSEWKPVAGLATSGDELVRVEDHDLVLVGLVNQYAVNCRGIGYHYGEPIAYQSEHALHDLWVYEFSLFSLYFSVCGSLRTFDLILWSGMEYDTNQASAPWGTSWGTFVFIFFSFFKARFGLIRLEKWAYLMWWFFLVWAQIL